MAGGPPRHTAHLRWGGGGLAASRRLLAREGRIRGGWWFTITNSAFQWGCDGRSGTTRCLAGSHPAFSGPEVVHDCALCLLKEGDSVRRSLVRAAASYTHLTHLRRAHLCDVPGHYLHRRLPATLPCSFSKTCPFRPHVPSPRRESTIRALSPLYLLPHDSYEPILVCRAPPPPARARPRPTPPLLSWKLPRRGCPALPLFLPWTMVPSFALRCNPTWACSF